MARMIAATFVSCLTSTRPRRYYLPPISEPAYAAVGGPDDPDVDEPSEEQNQSSPKTSKRRLRED
jgi:hypothetical protein